MNPVKLIQVSTQKSVDAEIVPLSCKHLADVETYWKYRLVSSNEEDSHWEWSKKYHTTITPNYERYALEYLKITQGLMILEIDLHYSRIEIGKSLIYVDYLATAPWNRPKLQCPPDYKGVGTSLFTLALSQSFDFEYKGRIGLHSLPDAEPFYRKLGMDDFGYDPSYHNLRYFELSKNVASKIINRFKN
jgi:hypothetical protein